MATGDDTKRAAPVRIAAVADLHGQLPVVPPCDVLVVAGDICPLAREVAGQATWLDGPFRQWLEAVPAGAVVGIAGNHDFVFEREPQRVPRDLPWTYLQDEGASVAGLSFWGSPWTPWFHDWAFNAPRKDGEAFLAKRYANVPSGTDVLVLHGPPVGYGDAVAGVAVGSTAELDLIERVTPRLCVYGHVHEGRGQYAHGATTLINAAAVDADYELLPDPVVVLDV